MDVFILDRTPGATDTVAWESICHRKQPFLFIRYSQYRDTSRWKHVERRRPFLVIQNPHWREMSAHATLEAAIAAAHKAARLLAA